MEITTTLQISSTETVRLGEKAFKAKLTHMFTPEAGETMGATMNPAMRRIYGLRKAKHTTTPDWIFPEEGQRFFAKRVGHGYHLLLPTFERGEKPAFLMEFVDAGDFMAACDQIKEDLRCTMAELNG